MEKAKYVLAMYDIRGKQEYIFRSRRIKEIMGASAVIRDCFKDYLYPQAMEYRNVLRNRNGDMSEAIFNYKDKTQSNDRTFSVDRFKQRMDSEQYLGEVVYDGGGNFFVLYKDSTTCIEINKRFTREILEKLGTLKVLCTYIEVDLTDYKDDRDRLYGKHRIYEARESAELPAQVLPFTQVDYFTSMPLCEMINTPRGKEKVTRESYQKYVKYENQDKNTQNEEGIKLLDELVTEKGKDSHLAIIYIDGNNMGAKVQGKLAGKTSYEECIAELRQFSEEIQQEYIDKRKEAIDEVIGKQRRLVVAAGDEINFICNAKDAYKLVKAYFENMPQELSACAGVAIFHSHMPYADAYRIAEECCENAKRKMKDEDLKDEDLKDEDLKDEDLKEANLMDVHYCQGGIGTDLETIRQREVGDLISKPWFISPQKDDCIDLDAIDNLAEELRKIGHSNVKSLLEHARNSMTNLKMELERIKAHSNVDAPILFSLLDSSIQEEEKQKIRRMIYDIVILYDLWFREEEEENE